MFDATRGRTAGGRPLVHPLAAPIASGLGLTLEEFVTIPSSKTDPPPPPGDNLDRWARINYLGEIPDGSGRLFVPDLNGKMYLIKDGKPQTYLDVGAEFAPNFMNTKSLSNGFVFVAFDPELNKTGKFYTAHTDAGPALNPKVPQTKLPDLPYPQEMPSQAVVTEWKAADPARALLRERGEKCFDSDSPIPYMASSRSVSTRLHSPVTRTTDCSTLRPVTGAWSVKRARVR